MERAEPRPSGTFFHTAPHRLHFPMQPSRPRFSPGGAVQIVAYQYNRPTPEKGPLSQITPALTERLYTIVMNNVNLNELVTLFVATFNTLNNREKATLSRAFVRDLMEGKAGAFSMQEVEVRGYGQHRREVLHDVEYKHERKSYVYNEQERFYDVRRIVGSWGWGQDIDTIEEVWVKVLADNQLELCMGRWEAHPRCACVFESKTFRLTF